MVSLIYVALKAMGSFSAPIYLLEVSILLNIAKVFLILIFFSENQLIICQCCFDFLFYLLFPSFC